MHHLVHQAKLQRLLRAHGLAGEDHLQRGLQPDQRRQALRAAGARDDAELHFGERNRRLRAVGRDAPVTGKRQLGAATEAAAVDCANHRLALFDGGKIGMTGAACCLGILSGTKTEECLDVGTGDEIAALAAEDHGGTDRGVALDGLESVAQILLRRRREGVDGRAGRIEGEHGDATLDLHGDGALCDGWSGHWLCGWRQTRSMTIANPRPPAAQTVSSPNCPPRRPSSLQSVVVMRAPVAPNG